MGDRASDVVRPLHVFEDLATRQVGGFDEVCRAQCKSILQFAAVGAAAQIGEKERLRRNHEIHNPIVGTIALGRERKPTCSRFN